MILDAARCGVAVGNPAEIVRNVTSQIHLVVGNTIPIFYKDFANLYSPLAPGIRDSLNLPDKANNIMCLYHLSNPECVLHLDIAPWVPMRSQRRGIQLMITRGISD